MEDAIDQAKASPARRKKSAFNRVDLMLIVATTAAFVAVAAANHHTRTRNRADLAATEVSSRVGQMQLHPGLTRARIGAAVLSNG